jgi:hypothetical protein
MGEGMTRRALTLLMAIPAVLMLMAGPAMAHYLAVDGEVKAFPGGADIPGQGEGLVDGGPPGGTGKISPSHMKGLNTACVKNRSQVVDIRGPNQFGQYDPESDCAHGS